MYNRVAAVVDIYVNFVTDHCGQDTFQSSSIIVKLSVNKGMRWIQAAETSFLLMVPALHIVDKAMSSGIWKDLRVIWC